MVSLLPFLSPAPGLGKEKKRDPGNDIEVQFGTTLDKSSKIWTQTVRMQSMRIENWTTLPPQQLKVK